MSKYQEIDNVLGQLEFQNLVKYVTTNLVWGYNTVISGEGEQTQEYQSYFSNLIFGLHPEYSTTPEELYQQNPDLKYIPRYWNSNPVDMIYFNGVLDRLDIFRLVRIKVNLYPRTHELRVHDWHWDYDFPHGAAVMNLFDCDGYTEMEDGYKHQSKANRMIVFDGSTQHRSTTCTNATSRMTLAINFI